MLSTRFLARVTNGSSNVVLGNVLGCGAAGSKGLTALTACSCGGMTKTSSRCLADIESMRKEYPRKKRLSEFENEDCDHVAPADSLITWKRGGAVRLRMRDSGRAAAKPITIMTAFRETAEKLPNNKALATKLVGNWTNHTYEEYYNETRRAARSFIQLGLEPHSAVGILGFNSPEWFVSSLGAIFAGGYSTGIYTTSTPEACQYVADHARCNVIVVEDDKQLQKILSIRDQLPHLKAIVQYRGQPDRHLGGVYSWSDFMAIGSQSIERELETRIKEQAANKCCMLVYTSGTTGNPKGVMLSHDNVVWTAMRSVEHLKIRFGGKERFLSYLPLSHVAAHMADLFVPIMSGIVVHFAQPDALQGSLGQTIKEVLPTNILGVPRVWEKIHEAVAAASAQSSPLKQSILKWAREAGTRANIARMSGREPSLVSKIADRLILSKVREAIGLHQADVCFSAAAPISRSTLDFLISLNLPLVEIFGMSELSGPHTCGIATNNAVGSAGIELSGTNTTILNPSDDGVGELLVHGRNVCMGYLEMEEKTLEAFGGPEGTYLHSGDLAKRDERGFLTIAGRIKELIITAGGENIPSVQVENAVKDSLPIISNCMLVGDGRRYLTMLLTIKTDVSADSQTPLNTLTNEVINWCSRNGSNATTVRDVINDVRLNDAIQKGIDATNMQAKSNAHKIQKWAILPTDFSLAEGELGPTLKLRRHIILRKYNDRIESMYEDPPQQTISASHDDVSSQLVLSGWMSRPSTNAS